MKALFINSLDNILINSIINFHPFSKGKKVTVITSEKDQFKVETDLKITNEFNRLNLSTKDSVKNGSRSSKLKLEQMISIIESTQEDSIIVLHNLLSIFSIYDKGDHRLVNFLITALNMNRKFIITYSATDINDLCRDNINAVAKRYNNSAPLITCMRREDILGFEFNGFGEESTLRYFKTTSAFIAQAKSKHYDKLQLALKELTSYKLRNRYLNSTDLEVMSTESDRIYDFKHCKSLAYAMGLNHTYVVYHLCLLMDRPESPEEVTYMQFNFYDKLIKIYDRDTNWGLIEESTTYSRRLHKCHFFGMLEQIKSERGVTIEAYKSIGFPLDLSTICEVMRYSYSRIPEEFGSFIKNPNQFCMKDVIDDFYINRNRNRNKFFNTLFTLMELKDLISPRVLLNN